MLTKEDIKKAVDQNVLVFDNNGAKDTLTATLSAYMIDVCLLNYNKRLTDIYIPPGVAVPDYPTSAGLTVHVAPELDRDGELFRYYHEDLGAVLYLTDKHQNLVIGMGEDGLVILGSIK